MDFSFWQKQNPDKPLFPDIEWEKPEQKSLSGKLLIIGGNSGGFAAVAQAYTDAIAAGIGECRVALPDSLKKSVGTDKIDCTFTPANPSGGISKDGLDQLKAAVAWADCVLYIGDAGRNSETAIVYDHLLINFANKINVVTRDAADLTKNHLPTLLNQPSAVLVLTLAQVQKLFQSVYYPKTVLFSMNIANLAEALHKFSTTYKATIVVFHQDQMLVAQNGQVTSTPYENPLKIWRGTVAANAAVYATQHPKKLLQAITTSLTK